METKQFKIDVIPAYFLEHTDEKIILACYIGDSRIGQPIIQKRAFSKCLVENIKNPTKLFIAIKIQPGMMTLDCMCAKHYQKSFVWLHEYLKKKGYYPLRFPGAFF